MKSSLIALGLALSLPTAALACSCMDTDDPVELKKLAAEIPSNALALVEIETVRAYDPATFAGEDARVVRTLAGSAASEFRIERRPFPSGASCDSMFQAGERAIVILYPASEAAGGRIVYRVSGLCTNHLLGKPAFRDAVAQSIGSGERG